MTILIYSILLIPSLLINQSLVLLIPSYSAPVLSLGSIVQDTLLLLFYFIFFYYYKGIGLVEYIST